MLFTVTIQGHAGEGMTANSPEEISAVRELLSEIQQSVSRLNLIGTATVQPSEWSPVPAASETSEAKEAQ